MSLINDALKRAKDAQPKSLPPAPGPQLRPAEFATLSGHGMQALIVLAVVLMAAISLLLLWQSRREMAAREFPTPAPVAVTETKPSVRASAISTLKPAAPPPIAKSAPDSPPIPAAAPAAPTPAANTPPLKLQAIFFAPGRSSAIISGKTVFAGDTLKGYRVAAISQTSVTLAGNHQTIVMTLKQ